MVCFIGPSDGGREGAISAVQKNSFVLGEVPFVRVGKLVVAGFSTIVDFVARKVSFVALSLEVGGQRSDSAFRECV